MDRGRLEIKLKRTLFISAMMGVSTGKFCARCGADAEMVQLGAILPSAKPGEPPADPRVLLPEQEGEIKQRLRREVAIARQALPDVVIGWNTAAGDADSACRFAAIAADAGADLYELNANGGYSTLVGRERIRALILPQNRRVLVGWLRRLVALGRVLIALKFYGGMAQVDYLQLVRDVARTGILALHLNVRHPVEPRPYFEFVHAVRPHFAGMLFCSGRVRTRRDVEGLFAAGADCVGLARGLVEDPQLLSKLALIKKPRRS